MKTILHIPAEQLAMWGVAATTAAVIIFLWLFPMVYVLCSRRSEGGAKFGWFIVAVCFSWIGLAVFLIVTKAPRSKALAAYERREPGGY